MTGETLESKSSSKSKKGSSTPRAMKKSPKISLAVTVQIERPANDGEKALQPLTNPNEGQHRLADENTSQRLVVVVDATKTVEHLKDAVLKLIESSSTKIEVLEVQRNGYRLHESQVIGQVLEHDDEVNALARGESLKVCNRLNVTSISQLDALYHHLAQSVFGHGSTLHELLAVQNLAALIEALSEKLLADSPK